MPKFGEIETLKDSEPSEVLTYLDKISEAIKLAIFPDLETFLGSNPTDILSLVSSGIRQDKIVPGKRVEDVDYDHLENSKIWNDLAIIYMSKGNLEKAERILRETIEAGARDSSTITNYGAVLLNRMIAVHVMDEESFKIAKEHTFRAFKFDVPKRGELYKGVLMPAFKNLVLMRNIEAEHFLNKGDLFTSFILGWISVEMSLLRIWSRLHEIAQLSDTKRKKMMLWDIALVIEILSMGKLAIPGQMVDLIPSNLRDLLDTLRETRNRLIHGSQIEPTRGEVEQCIHLGRQLIPILQ